MGDLLVAHVVRTTPRAEALNRLPSALSWIAYRRPATDAVLIDVYRRDRAPIIPFDSLPRLPDLAEELPTELAPLNALYDALLRQKRASAFRRRFINLNLLLSHLLEETVLSFVSDDDGLDLACSSIAGRMCRLRFETARVEIMWSEGRGAIQPLVFDDDVFVTDHDLQLLKASLPESRLLPPMECLSVLHRISDEEFRAFLGLENGIPGLETWDGRTFPIVVRGR